MSVLPQFFLAFMSGDFLQFPLSSAGHLASPLYEYSNGYMSATMSVWNMAQKRSIAMFSNFLTQRRRGTELLFVFFNLRVFASLREVF
jgi:hypothetical protein